MRAEQLTDRLLAAVAIACCGPLPGTSPRAFLVPTVGVVRSCGPGAAQADLPPTNRIGSASSPAAKRDAAVAWQETAVRRPATGANRSPAADPDLPLADVRRVALLLPDESADPTVRSVVAAERSAHARRRRLGLFAPKPAPGAGSGTAAPPGKSGAGSGSTAPKGGAGRGFAATPARSADGRPAEPPGKGTRGGAAPSAPSVRQTNPAAPAPATASPTDLSDEQLRDVAQALYSDALAARLPDRIAAQVIPQADLGDALAALKLSRSAPPSPAALRALCDRLNCDAVLVPTACSVRSLEAQVRAVAIWSNLRVLRPAGRARRASEADLPVAGAAVSDRAPFQDRFYKDWPQLATEAATQAADVAAHSLATGVPAPLVRPQDRVAVLPVRAPAQADALVFQGGGRSVLPNALKQMPGDVTSHFHPDLLPVFPESVVTLTDGASGPGRRPDDVWIRGETPDPAAAAAIGRRLKVQYVLMARVADLQMSIEMAGGPDAPSPGQAVAHYAESQESATAEAVGALVRVADGALLWSARTTATMTGRTRSGEAAALARRRIAVDAVRFSLVQLERRFRQYRNKFQ
ncbi:MAG TPA: hypothetical protein VKT77_13470 [Chthonomonadaceae bacterium]|nr:hypothetical protein [Chthonomonadaceae bacterium]